MNASELLPFVPAVVFAAVAAFAAWRISRTGSVAVPAETPLAKQSDTTPAKVSADTISSENKVAGPLAWATVKWATVQTESTRVDLGYSTSIGSSIALPDAVNVIEETVGVGPVAVDRIRVVYADQSLSKEPRQTAH